MRAHLRQFAGLVAIITIALHTGLWGIAAAHPVASGVDPFSVICHSGTTDDTTEQPANQAPARTHACDHCNLCGTAPLSSLPAAVSVLKLAPAPLLHRLVAANVLASAGIVSRSNFARGPPVFA
jgi:hypothetical protein